jgi:hypothetical protein
MQGASPANIRVLPRASADRPSGARTQKQSADGCGDTRKSSSGPRRRMQGASPQHSACIRGSSPSALSVRSNPRTDAETRGNRVQDLEGECRDRLSPQTFRVLLRASADRPSGARSRKQSADGRGDTRKSSSGPRRRMQGAAFPANIPRASACIRGSSAPALAARSNPRTDAKFTFRNPCDERS